MENSRLSSDVERLAESLQALPGPTARPALVVVSGLPGTGKSHFSARLAERVALAILESDSLRKVLFPSPDYSAQESTRLFNAIHALIRRLLTGGIPIILDATTLYEAHREQLYSVAGQTGARLILVEVKAPPELVHSRLEQRKALHMEVGSGKSDAGWEVYVRMAPTVEEIRHRHYSVDTSHDIEPVIHRIVKEIENHQTASA